jgi:DNA-binding NarL/FixJ family response regulator
LATLIPGSQFVPLESRNHILMEHEPAWQQFVSTVRDFLSTTEPTVPADSSEPALLDLTARERAVLDLIAQGLDNAQIAERLVVSPKTVRNHITSIFSKLGITTRAQAIVRARDAGLGQTRTPGKP